MQTTDGDWKNPSHLRDSAADDVTVPETPGLQSTENAGADIKYSAGTNTDDTPLPIPSPLVPHQCTPEEVATPPTIAERVQLEQVVGSDGAPDHLEPNSARASSHCAAAAVESDKAPGTSAEAVSEPTSASKRPFDCNVCFDLATDPVVTRCGHLYCWPCLHAWLQQARECPVCKAQVTKETVVPIYGQGQDAVDPRSKVRNDHIPQRPRPERVEAARRRPQQPNQSPWNLGVFAGSTLSFGIFPIGVGVTWPGTWFNSQGTPVASSEEIFSQLLALAFLFVAIFVTLGIVFVGEHSPEF
eukprot:Gregarina_sp_Pseudo_9__1813@NODE_2232_length_1085_cov_13_557361_g2055_i0_p1_GENE_NODE_2232_length_1085_cov_13_557361_g2055_i0NODE_2232_length_1085_cov_13_557361_g2055_i0_p1_ORF_typecomplete_len300_score6_43zfC3HC4_2/PF13923_6/1_7e14zfC3HC4_3/PF13920_6/3e13ProkRING_4/PF14447_6/1_7e11zfC3HC4/PF00097_25/7_1e11zfRING_5/PF14634_6/7_4e10zfC3HC4_4/PF15227_6/3_3e09zfRING_UBOX/PF13445_6/1_3e08zfRING_UBOX/PF13445_6/2_2e02Ubox/PF04564_15/5_5e08zfRING_2/PF13639_6/5_4e07zfRING_6/PF14835_6/2_5e06zfNOSIP/PF159